MFSYFPGIHSILLIDHFKLGIHLCICIVVGLILAIITWILSKKNPNMEKLSAYECGFEPFNNAQSVYDVHYIIIALLFLIFDLELLFLIPGLMILSSKVVATFFVFLAFFFILTLGFLYELYLGTLDLKYYGFN